QRAADGFENQLAFARVVFAYTARRFSGKERDCALARLESALDVQRFPRILFFILGDTVRKLAGIAERGHINLAGTRAAEIAENQLQRTAECTVGARGIAEDVAAASEAKLAAHRAIDDHERRSEVCRRLHAVKIEALIASR